MNEKKKKEKKKERKVGERYIRNKKDLSNKQRRK